MVFSSTLFIFLFLPLTILFYYLLPSNKRNLTIVFVSIIFYTWGEGSRFWLLLLVSLISYYTALYLDRIELDSKLRKRILILSVASNLGLLIYFKYFTFLVGIVNSFFSIVTNTENAHWGFSEIALPLGISFYVFQNISYVFDVYRNEITAKKKIVEYFCYTTMFPHLVAGPIVRYADIASELENRKESIDLFSEGVQRFVVGLAKKVIIANAVAQGADSVFNLPDNELTFSSTWVGGILYTMQIYFDFSGYSDMAIGLGKMFGFNFKENFNYPYTAVSIKDFWRRWHISLSTWFRDYLYIPLGGNKGSTFQNYRNLLIVFILCGLWHGANWTFVLWGLFHGLLLILERTKFGEWQSKLWVPLRRAYTLFFVMIGWILFRSENLLQFKTYILGMISTPSANEFLSVQEHLPYNVILAFGLGVLFSFPVKINKPQVTWSSASVTVAILFVSIFELIPSSFNPFLYFRF